MWSSSRLWDDEILCAALRLLWASFRRRRSALREDLSSSFIGVVVVSRSFVSTPKEDWALLGGVSLVYSTIMWLLLLLLCNAKRIPRQYLFRVL